MLRPMIATLFVLAVSGLPIACATSQGNDSLAPATSASEVAANVQATDAGPDTVTRPDPNIVVKVLDVDGAPVADAWVEIRESTSQPVISDTGRIVAVGASDSAGAIAFDLVGERDLAMQAIGRTQEPLGTALVNYAVNVFAPCVTDADDIDLGYTSYRFVHDAAFTADHPDMHPFEVGFEIWRLEGDFTHVMTFTLGGPYAGPCGPAAQP